MQRLIDTRNKHTNTISQYPILAIFQKIKISVGANHVLVFNPTIDTKNELYIDELESPIIKDNVFQMIMRLRQTTDEIDMDECERQYADLFLECLTKKRYMEEYPEAPDIASSTRVIIIFYGTRKFFIPVTNTTCKRLRTIFGYKGGTRWKTHSFKFRVQSVLSRLLI